MKKFTKYFILASILLLSFAALFTVSFAVDANPSADATLYANDVVISNGTLKSVISEIKTTEGTEPYSTSATTYRIEINKNLSYWSTGDKSGTCSISASADDSVILNFNGYNLESTSPGNLFTINTDLASFIINGNGAEITLAPSSSSSFAMFIRNNNHNVKAEINNVKVNYTKLNQANGFMIQYIGGSLTMNDVNMSYSGTETEIASVNFIQTWSTADFNFNNCVFDKGSFEGTSLFMETGDWTYVNASNSKFVIDNFMTIKRKGGTIAEFNKCEIAATGTVFENTRTDNQSQNVRLENTVIRGYSVLADNGTATGTTKLTFTPGSKVYSASAPVNDTGISIVLTDGEWFEASEGCWILGDSSLMNVIGANLSFEVQPHLMFAVNTYKDVQLLVFKTNPNGNYSEPDAVLTSTDRRDFNGYTCLVFKYTELPAYEMGKEIYVCAFDGTSYSNVIKYSILQYATTMIATSQNLDLVSMCRSMLQYGADSQKYFGDTSDRVNEAYAVVKVIGGTINGFETAVVKSGTQITIDGEIKNWTSDAVTITNNNCTIAVEDATVITIKVAE